MRLSHVLLEPEAGAQIRALPPRARLSGGLGLEARQAARGRLPSPPRWLAGALPFTRSLLWAPQAVSLFTFL